MGLLQTLLRPDSEERELGERMVIAKAANALQVGEFQLLQLAYHDWFGKDLPETLISQLFSAYMLAGQVPPWARHYARKINVLSDKGQLHDYAPGFHVYDHDYHTYVPEGARRFWGAVAMLVGAIGGAIILASLSIGTPTSMFPPYLDETELRPRGEAVVDGRADDIQNNSTLPDMGVVGAGKTR